MIRLIIFLLPAFLCAREVQDFKQHNMGKWDIPTGNYSGITHIEGNRYALISDKQEADGWTEVSISFLPSGDIDRMQFVAHHHDTRTRGQARDSEGIAYVSGQGFFIAAENDQRILELSAEGIPTGRSLAVPNCFASSGIFQNYGFESLTFNAGQGIFWLTTEQGLKSDMTAPASHDSTTPILLRLQSFGIDLQPQQQFAYMTDIPKARLKPRHYAFGVSELLALNDTTLLVMERELNVPRYYNRARCINRIYAVNPHGNQAIADTSIPLSRTDRKNFLAKKLLHSFSTKFHLIGKKNLANYEGMCLGPELADGKQVILLIADSQNRAGFPLFHLKDYIKVLVLDP